MVNGKRLSQFTTNENPEMRLSKDRLRIKMKKGKSGATESIEGLNI